MADDMRRTHILSNYPQRDNLKESKGYLIDLCKVVAYFTQLCYLDVLL